MILYGFLLWQAYCEAAFNAMVDDYWQAEYERVCKENPL